MRVFGLLILMARGIMEPEGYCCFEFHFLQWLPRVVRGQALRSNVASAKRFVERIRQHATRLRSSIG